MTPATATPDVLSRVRAGVAWLDANIPDWLGRVNEKRIDVRGSSTCVLAPLSEDGFDFDGNFGLAYETKLALGLSYEADDFMELNKAWPSEIRRLRKERKAR